MFKIEYIILEEEKKKISEMENICEYEYNISTIVGQIKLSCNDNSIGFVDAEIPYDGDFILEWFSMLNEIIIELNNSDFITMLVPGSVISWVEFKKVMNMVEISEIRSEISKDIEKTITNVQQKAIEVYFTESIMKEEFITGVLEGTQCFLDDILSINNILSESRGVMKLQNLFNRAKDVYLKEDGEYKFDLSDFGY